jgi:hypothetical protein
LLLPWSKSWKLLEVLGFVDCHRSDEDEPYGWQVQQGLNATCSKQCHSISFHSITYIHINTHASFNIPRVADPAPEDSMRYKNSSVKPWLDRNGRVIWPYSRIAMAKIVRSQSFETFMGIVIMLNILWLDVAKVLGTKN